MDVQKNKFPLWHKNFSGATLPIVPVRIVDIVDDLFIIEYQSGKTSSVKQADFINFHKSIKWKNREEINKPSKTFSDDDIPF
jgi:hypothetical protein